MSYEAARNDEMLKYAASTRYYMESIHSQLNAISTWLATLVFFVGMIFALVGAGFIVYVTRH